MRDFATPSGRAKECAPEFNCGWSLSHLLITLSLQAEPDPAREAAAEEARERRSAAPVEPGNRPAP